MDSSSTATSTVKEVASTNGIRRTKYLGVLRHTVHTGESETVMIRRRIPDKVVPWTPPMGSTAVVADCRVRASAQQNIPRTARPYGLASTLLRLLPATTDTYSGT
jgi:hypothetical protein